MRVNAPCLAGGVAGRAGSSAAPNIRVNAPLYLDASLLKVTHINERLSLQFGFEAFNILNHNYFGRDNINTSIESTAFGSVIPATVSTQNILPRQIQVRFKFLW